MTDKRLTRRDQAVLDLIVNGHLGDPVMAFVVPVRSTDGTATYRVTVAEDPALSGCTCPASGRCKHLDAVRARMDADGHRDRARADLDLVA